MINFPYLSVDRKLPSHTEPINEMLGYTEWQDLEGVFLNDERERRLVDSYRSTLRQQDNGLAVKRIGFEFPDRERTIYYLFLTTHDPTGALEINRLLDEVELRHHRLIEEYRRGDQMPLFAMPLEARPATDKEIIANQIHESCRGETIQYREVMKRMVDTSYHPNHIRSAMTVLKRAEKASYDELKNSSLIKFE